METTEMTLFQVSDITISETLTVLIPTTIYIFFPLK